MAMMTCHFRHVGQVPSRQSGVLCQHGVAALNFFLVGKIGYVPTTEAKENRGHDFYHFEEVFQTKKSYT